MIPSTSPATVIHMHCLISGVISKIKAGAFVFLFLTGSTYGADCSQYAAFRTSMLIPPNYNFTATLNLALRARGFSSTSR